MLWISIVESVGGGALLGAMTPPPLFWPCCVSAARMHGG
jgi:hypothetical protein